MTEAAYIEVMRLYKYFDISDPFYARLVTGKKKRTHPRRGMGP